MDATIQSAGQPGAVVPVAIYTRVSTDNQVGGRFDSCESQLAICRDHIGKHVGQGWIEVAHYSDPAVSGSTMNRPGLRQLLRQIETGGVKVVLIFKLERMSRNIDEWGPFRNFLKKHGCRLESATEDISETTPSGRLKNNLMLSFSQYERENTAEKTQVKMVQQAKRGYWNGGAVPFGYAYDKNTQTLQPHAEEAPVVRRIFEQAAQLVTLEKIADALNREGLRTRARLFRRTDGTEHTVGVKRFRSDALRLMVTNPIYRGVIRYAGREHPGRHEPLVPGELWERANAAVIKTVRPVELLKPDQDKHFHLLKGLVHCGCCHRALVPHASGNRDESGRFYRYYYCGHLVKERGDSRCTVRRIAAGSLESAVVQFLGGIGRHPDLIDAAVDSARSGRQKRRDELKNELGRLARELAETNKRIRHCIEAISTGGKKIAEELAEEVAALKDQKQGLVVRRERLAQEWSVCEGEILDAARVCRSVARFGQILQGLSRDEQKTLVGLLVERIEVHPAKDDASGSNSGAVRRLELRFKLNVPRLVEGMAEGVVTRDQATPQGARGLILSALVAVGQQGRSNQAMVLAPFRCGDEVLASGPAPVPPPPSAGVVQHPLWRALAWKKTLAQNPALSLRGLAKREGEVAPSLVRHFKLLRLAPEIRSYLAALRDPKAVYFFSLRRLLPLAELGVDDQRRLFCEWREAFEGPHGAARTGSTVMLAPAAKVVHGVRPS